LAGLELLLDGQSLSSESLIIGDQFTFQAFVDEASARQIRIRPLRPIYCRNSRCGEMRIDELIGVCDASGGKWIGDLDVAVGGLAA